jgi:hypothetical protein
VSASIEGPSDDLAARASAPDGLSVSRPAAAGPRTLSALPVGARLILRCRKDWREAIVAACSPEHVTLTVCSSRGSTYRVRRPPETPLFEDGPFPVVGGEGSWRMGLVRYDWRW